MGRSRLIPFTITIRCTDGARYTPSEWRVRPTKGTYRADGPPSPENIARWVKGFENSRRPGGCNEHLGFAAVVSASVKDQKRGEIVATWFQ